MTKSFLYIAAIITVLSACSSANEEATLSSYNTSDICIYANASKEEIDYPITVAAYQDGDNAIVEKQITDEGLGTTLSLTNGHYTITACAGDNNFSNGYTTSRPFMMAVSDDVNVNKNTELSLSMSYRVAKISVSLTDMEQDVTAVSVTINSTYAQISNKGVLSGTISPNIHCTKDDNGAWNSGVFYVLPSTDENAEIVITKTTEEGTKAYSTTIDGGLKAANTYNLKGKYDNTYTKYKLQVTLSAEGWKEDVTKDFTFNDKDETSTTPGDNTGGSTDTPSGDISVTKCSIWNGHIVALVNGNKVLLLSKTEWKLNSASERPAELATYTEDEYSDWRIPTDEEASELLANYNNADGTMNTLNDLLTSNGLDKLNKGTSTSNIRYIYGDGSSAISFVNNRTVSTSDASKDYRIRLVKEVTISK